MSWTTLSRLFATPLGIELLRLKDTLMVNSNNSLVESEGSILLSDYPESETFHNVAFNKSEFISFTQSTIIVMIETAEYITNVSGFTIDNIVKSLSGYIIVYNGNRITITARTPAYSFNTTTLQAIAFETVTVSNPSKLNKYIEKFQRIKKSLNDKYIINSYVPDQYIKAVKGLLYHLLHLPACVHLVGALHAVAGLPLSGGSGVVDNVSNTSYTIVTASGLNTFPIPSLYRPFMSIVKGDYIEFMFPITNVIQLKDCNCGTTQAFVPEARWIALSGSPDYFSSRLHIDNGICSLITSIKLKTSDNVSGVVCDVSVALMSPTGDGSVVDSKVMSITMGSGGSTQIPDVVLLGCDDKDCNSSSNIRLYNCSESVNLLVNSLGVGTFGCPSGVQGTSVSPTFSIIPTVINGNTLLSIDSIALTGAGTGLYDVEFEVFTN